MINTEFTHTFTAALHFDGRKCILRWHSNQRNQSRCLTVEYYRHSTNGTPMFHLKNQSNLYVRWLNQTKAARASQWWGCSRIFGILYWVIVGTLRRNLDPFEQNDDATLNSALRASGLFSLQTDTDEARLTLDYDIAGGGKNLSVGQRQIIALARAILRNSKLLILDEGESFYVFNFLLITYHFVVATSAIGMYVLGVFRKSN